MKWSAAYEVRAGLPHFVYMAWDADGLPLYVGCTSNLENRMHDHRYQSGWYGRLHTLTVMEYPNRALALEVESRQIWKLRPKANIQGNPRYQSVEDYDHDYDRPLTIRERKAEALRILRTKGGAA